MCLTNFSARHVVRFLLGAALNIRQVLDDTGRPVPYGGDYGGRMIGEAREYVIRRPDSLPAFSKVCVEYRGAVPLFETNSATSDWKGRIVAINGTIRAAEQSRWYPTLFDSTTTATEDAVTYRLAVRCATCQSIYVNGSPPVGDTSGMFVSTTPRSPLLYAGRFSIQRTAVATFLGGAASNHAEGIFTAAISQIGEYYAKLLRIPYNERPVLLSFQSISRDYHPGQVDWAFVTWPTIAFSGGLDFDKMLESGPGGDRIPDWLWGTLSHEMGHYYFGTIRNPHGPLYWVILESTAEYLSLKSIGALRDDLALTSRLVGNLPVLAPKYSALSEITDKDQISGSYRYQFAPMALLALDRRVGEPRVMQMLRALLNAPSTETSDYAALIRAAASAGISEDEVTGSTSVDAIRSDVLTQAGRTLAGSEALADGRRAVALATSLINADTTLAGRLGVMRFLQQLVQADSTNTQALYQIGKVGALTGRELDAAKAALERYIQMSPKGVTPSHADAYWRLGTIAERRGRRDEARALYGAALNADPTHVSARQSLVLLDSKSKPRDN
jgi:hypothetical protein